MASRTSTTSSASTGPASAVAFREKFLTVPPPIEVAGRRIKRYHVTAPATFVVLHRGGDDGAYLNAYSWVWDNVLHFRGAAAGQPVLGCPDQDPTHFITPDLPWIGCVWELPPILHERDAWVRHMLAPDTPDLDAYLADSLPEGTTGD